MHIYDLNKIKDKPMQSFYKYLKHHVIYSPLSFYLIIDETNISNCRSNRLSVKDHFELPSIDIKFLLSGNRQRFFRISINDSYLSLWGRLLKRHTGSLHTTVRNQRYKHWNNYED